MPVILKITIIFLLTIIIHALLISHSMLHQHVGVDYYISKHHCCIKLPQNVFPMSLNFELLEISVSHQCTHIRYDDDEHQAVACLSTSTVCHHQHWYSDHADS
jgi:hypothetical protein